MWRSLFIITSFLFCFGATQVQAQELTTSRGLALSGALAASANGSSAVWHNPAGIATSLMYTADAAYTYDNARSGHGIEANLMDMKSNPYVGSAIGFLYEYSGQNGRSRHTTQTRLGLAMPLADGLVNIGVSGIYSHSKLDGRRDVSLFSMDAGIIVRPLPWFNIGFSAQNLITGDHADLFPRKLSSGIAFSWLSIGLNLMGEVVFNVSAKEPKNTAEYAAAIEYLLVRSFPLRLSYRYESLYDNSIVSAGVGYRDKSGIFGLDVSYQHQFNNKNHIVSSSLGIYF